MALAGIDLLQITGLLLTLAYFFVSEDNAIERALLGIISAVIWFGVAALTIQEFAFGYSWAMLYILIAIVLMLLSVNAILRTLRHRGRA